MINNNKGSISSLLSVEFYAPASLPHHPEKQHLVQCKHKDTDLIRVWITLLLRN